MILIWFTGLLFQVIVFILGFLVFALGVIIAVLPIRCIRCKCE